MCIKNLKLCKRIKVATSATKTLGTQDYTKDMYASIKTNPYCEECYTLSNSGYAYLKT